MAKKYQAPKPTGREYVDAAKEFQRFTTHMLLKLPEKWKDYLLNPLHASADRIESLALRANRVYISPEHMNVEELKEAFQLRIGLLQEAIREFDVFDTKFVHLTDHIELMQDEMKRMKAVLKNLISQELKKEEQETGRKCEIEVHQYPDQIEYTTTLGTKTVKLGMSPKNKDHWLDLEIRVKEEITRRITADRKFLHKLNSQ